MYLKANFHYFNEVMSKKEINHRLKIGTFARSIWYGSPKEGSFKNRGGLFFTVKILGIKKPSTDSNCLFSKFHTCKII